MIKYLIIFSSLLVAQPLFPDKLVEAAVTQTKSHVKYDGSYYALDYPMGDIPRHIGVCTDVIIRAYRDCCGIDLQQLVHEDMLDNPDDYDIAVEIDSNIDHRRVRNLRVFFENAGSIKSIRPIKTLYHPGDIVTWNLYKDTLPHIGIVRDQYTDDGIPLIIHNAGGGVVVENILFKFNITGHYKYRGQRRLVK